MMRILTLSFIVLLNINLSAQASPAPAAEGDSIYVAYHDGGMINIFVKMFAQLLYYVHNIYIYIYIVHNIYYGSRRS